MQLNHAKAYVGKVVSKIDFGSEKICKEKL